MGSYNSKVFGRTLHDLRKERKFSQEVLSSMAELTRSHLSNIENGKVNPGIDTVWTLAECLGVPTSELLRLAEESMKQQ